jgi:hypothetical protein
MSQGETPNTENQLLKEIVSYWNQLVILNDKLSERLTTKDLSAIQSQKQNHEFVLLDLLDQFRSRLEFVQQVQPDTVAIDVAKGVEALRIFLTKTTIQIIVKEVETFLKA